jgi:hypothetical protein
LTPISPQPLDRQIKRTTRQGGRQSSVHRFAEQPRVRDDVFVRGLLVPASYLPAVRLARMERAWR